MKRTGPVALAVSALAGTVIFAAGSSHAASLKTSVTGPALVEAAPEDSGATHPAPRFGLLLLVAYAVAGLSFSMRQGRASS